MGVHCALTELRGRGVFGGSWQKPGSRGQGQPGGGQAGTGLGLVVALRHGASGHAGLGRRVHPPRAPSREELSDLTLPPQLLRGGLRAGLTHHAAWVSSPQS